MVRPNMNSSPLTLRTYRGRIENINVFMPKYRVAANRTTRWSFMCFGIVWKIISLRKNRPGEHTLRCDGQPYNWIMP